MFYTGSNFNVPEQKKIRVIVNTDAKNEADDQYAIVHALLSPRFDIRGFIAAHFGSEKSDCSMLESYDEVTRIFDLMRVPYKDLIFKGAERPVENKWEPVVSEGADLIIREAMSDETTPLYVLFLGPVTDLASAYRMEPRIAERLTAVWIGGGPYPGGGQEYNLSNDILAARIVMESNIRLWQIPQNVYEMVRVSCAELEYRVSSQGELGKYLFVQLIENGHSKYGIRTPIRTGEVWFLGDSPAIGLLLCEQRYDYDWMRAPLIGDDMSYSLSALQRPIRVYKNIDTRFILEDFYAKLALFNSRCGENLWRMH